ncbi:hypothetical protein YC2023_107352 [Brassica napus]
MLVLLDSAELHQRSSQFKGAVRWSGKAARLRSGFLDQRSTSCPCCRRARGSVGVLLQLRSTSLRSGVANGGVVDLRWFGFLSGSQRRRVRKVFPSALSPDGQSFAVCARWDPFSQLRWKLWVSSGVRVPHPLSFLFRLCSCRQVRFLFFRQWYRLCLAVVSLLLRFIPTFNVRSLSPLLSLFLGVDGFCLPIVASVASLGLLSFRMWIEDWCML